MDNNQKGNTFFNGFLWGALLGAGVVFLVGTKKGKKLLEVLTKEGLEGVSQLGDMIDNLSEEENYQKEEEPEAKTEEPQTESHALKNNTRRFFRRKAP